MLTLHVLSALFSFGVVWKADKSALSWVRGRSETLQERELKKFHILTWLSLAALILSGAFLSYPMLGYLLSQPLFIMKLLFIAVLLVNAVLIGRLMHVATERSFESLTWAERMPLLMSGAISGIAWGSALILAFVVFK